MKKLFSLFLIGFTVFAFAQININNEINNEIKPKLDSTKDIVEYRYASQFLGLIGEKIYAYPLIKDYDYSYTSFNTLYKLKKKYKSPNGYTFKEGEYLNLNKEQYENIVAGKYFEVYDVKFIKGNEVSPLKWETENFYSQFQGETKLYIKSSDNDVFLYITGGLDNYKFYISIPFFEFMKKKYIGNQILYDPYIQYQIPINIDKNSIVHNYKKENIYKVIDLYLDNSSFFYTPKLYLKVEDSNNNIKRLPIELGGTAKKYYTLKDDYDKFLNSVKKENEIFDNQIKLKLEEEYSNYIKEKKQRDEIRLNILSKKYGSKIANRILNGDVWIGMTRQMLIDSKGEPDSIGSSIETKYSYTVQYIYNIGTYTKQYIYLENGKVVTIQY